LLRLSHYEIITVKSVTYLAKARRALRKHKTLAERIMDKVDAFSKVKTLKGGGKRLRVGSFRVIFEETPQEIIVTDIGPRGGIYD
jgi:mRNA interferase RelE/StbE